MSIFRLILFFGIFCFALFSRNASPLFANVGGYWDGHCRQCCHCPGMLSLGVGRWDFFPGRNHQLQFQVEYKFSASWHGVQPFTSVLFTDKGSFYGCFGACYDIFLGKYFVLTPSFAPGLYLRGSGKDLGFPLEFRSSIALATIFRNCHRLGLQFYHISNASLGNKNPGTESLVLFYSLAIW